MTKEDISIQQLGEITAYDQESTAVKLAELWRNNTAVLLFVRHFG